MKINKAILGSCIGIMLFCYATFAQKQNKHVSPNILILMSDQHRPDALGSYGDKNALTPVLDNLAASGISLRQAYCQDPVCVPSRNSILTGLYAHSSGVIDNGSKANTTKLSFLQVFRENGYKTACFGKLHTSGREKLDWDLLNYGHPEGRTEEGVLPNAVNLKRFSTIGAPDPNPKTKTMEWLTKENTIKFLRENASTPWVVQCSMLKPHPAYQPPQEYWDKIDRSQLVIPYYPSNDLEDCDPRYAKMMRMRGMGEMTQEQILDGMQGYYGNIAFVDDMFGEVLTELDRLGLRKNTLIVYLADHGEMLNEHGLWTKFVFFDPSVRVPLIMSKPDLIPAGQVSYALVELIDLFPTFTELADIQTPAEVQGISLLPLITGKTSRHRDLVHSEYPLDGNVSGGEFHATMMLFDGRYKYIDNGPESFPELYDQKTDPHEFNNIASNPDQKIRVEHMQEQVSKWHNTSTVPNTQLK